MKNCKMIIAIILIGVLAMGSLAWSSDVEKIEEKTFKFKPGGTITITGDEGNISITSWDRDEVYLKMTKRAYGRNEKEAEKLLELIDVEIREGNNRLVIKELKRNRESRFNFFDLFDGDFWTDKRWRSGYVDFELKVPSSVGLKVRCDEGDVDIMGTRGDLNIHVDEGNIELDTIVSEDLEVNVDEGEVQILSSKDEGRGYWKIGSDEGPIDIDEADVDELDIHSDEGDIKIRDLTVKRLWLSTDEGDILADFTPENEGQYRMEADEGDFEIIVPEDCGLRVKIQSDEGRIDTQFSLDCRRYDDGEICEGVIGEEEQSFLRAFTDEGEVYLRKK